MREKLVLGIVLLGTILTGVFLVAAFVFQNAGNTDAQSADFGTGGTSLEVVDVNSDVFEDDTFENDDDETETEDEEFEGEDETETPITGTALEKASASALAYIGEGKVTDTEIGDEEGYYEIEITLRNGREVDVHLDENFKIISTEYD